MTLPDRKIPLEAMFLNVGFRSQHTQKDRGHLMGTHTGGGRVCVMKFSGMKLLEETGWIKLWGNREPLLVLEYQRPSCPVLLRAFDEQFSQLAVVDVGQ